MPYIGHVIRIALLAAAFSQEPILKPPMTVDTLIASGAVVQKGVAPRYNDGGMEGVAKRRGIPPAPCMVSRPDGPIGGWVWVWGRNTNTLLHCKIVDVSDLVVKCQRGRCESDRDRHWRTGRIVELSYKIALLLCSRKHINHRPEQCPVTVFYYATP